MNHADQQRYQSDLRKALALVEKSADVATEARARASAVLAKHAFLESRLTSARELLLDGNGSPTWRADRDAWLNDA